MGVAWLALAAPAAALPIGGLWISEVMANPAGPDNGNEWVELYNSTSSAIDLSNYTLGWGGAADYSTGTLALSGSILPGQYFVIGGGAPTIDLAADFNPDLLNGFLVSDGVALFQNGVTNPVHVVIYGGIFGNLVGLIDETGAVGSVDVGIPAAGSSIVFDGSSWSTSATPTPGTGSLPAVPEPDTASLLLVAAAAFAATRSKRA